MMNPQQLQQHGIAPVPELLAWMQRSSARCAGQDHAIQAQHARWINETVVAAARHPGVQAVDWARVPTMPGEAVLPAQQPAYNQRPQQPSGYGASASPRSQPPPGYAAYGPPQHHAHHHHHHHQPAAAPANPPWAQHVEAQARARLIEECTGELGKRYGRNADAHRAAMAHFYATMKQIDAEVARGSRSFSSTRAEDVLRACSSASAAPSKQLPGARALAGAQRSTAADKRRPRSPDGAAALSRDTDRRAPRVEDLNDDALRARMQRFAGDSSTPTPAASPVSRESGMPHFGIGTSDALERRYTREEPKQHEIRPRAVLPKALEHIVAKSASGHFSVDFEAARWLSDQLKGMRQDIKVQRLKDAFVVGVYERHARLCLRVQDLLEFNQCQAALRVMYSEGVTTDAATTAEFTAYRVLYLALSGQTDSMALELRAARKDAPDVLASPMMRLVVRLAASIEGDNAPAVVAAVHRIRHSSDCERIVAGVAGLITLFAQRLRVRWLLTLSSGAKGSISAGVVAVLLGFPLLDDIAVEHTLLPPAPRGEPEVPRTASRAWSDLFETVGVKPAPAFPKITRPAKLSSKGAQLDLGEIGTAVRNYCSFINSSSSGGVDKPAA